MGKKGTVFRSQPSSESGGKEEREVLIPKIIYFHKGKRSECENALFDPPKHSPFSFYKTSPSIQILPAKEAKKR